MSKAQNNIRRVALVGLMGALTVTLSVLEGMLPPLPILPPGAKLGLSNIVLLLAAWEWGFSLSIPLAVLKGLMVLLSRGATAGIMSLSAGLVSALVITLLFSFKRCPLGLAGISMVGALCHNATQLCCSRWLMGTPAVWGYAPVLLLLALPAGLLTGSLLRLLLPAVGSLLQKSAATPVERKNGS